MGRCLNTARSPPQKPTSLLLFLLLLLLLLLSTAAASTHHHHAALLANLTGVVPGLDCVAVVKQAPPTTLPPATALPRALHFVWVGGRAVRPLPPKYCANLATFVACLRGEGYTINLWTDAPPPPACLPAGITLRDAPSFLAARPALAAALAARANVGYRADMLRYAVIAAEGGVYSDVDATCLRSPAAAW
jgi:hypothetical protein